jgi:hypothetical protein
VVNAQLPGSSGDALGGGAMVVMMLEACVSYGGNTGQW